VPFPFVETPRLRDRPALVISDGVVGGEESLLWVIMITSAANSGWRDDVSIEDCHADCGLPVPCVIRTAKISTVEAKSARLTGAVPMTILTKVRELVGRHVGL
jgi:mRNA interferase MazF